MDLFSATNQKGTVYGFLSVTWGLTSDVDIESEKYRRLGKVRFTIGAIQRILGLRHYHGSLYYLPVSDSDESPDVEQQGIAREERQSNGVNEESHVIESNGNIELDTKNQNGNSAGRSKVQYGPKPTIPDINEPLGGEWKSVQGEYILVCLSSISHLAPDMHAAPGAYLNDGILDIAYVLKGASKKTMLELLGAFESGKHVEHEAVERLKIKAFRLVPGKERLGHMVVDGEEVDYEPIQGEILPSLANVISLKR